MLVYQRVMIKQWMEQSDVPTCQTNPYLRPGNRTLFFFFVGELLRHLTIVLFCLEKMCLLKYFQPIIWQGRRVNCGECISITNCIEYCVFVGMEF